MVQDIITTNGKVFPYRETCHLAALIYRRFGCDLAAAFAAWERMLQTTGTEPADFQRLVDEGFKYNTVMDWRAENDDANDR